MALKSTDPLSVDEGEEDEKRTEEEKRGGGGGGAAAWSLESQVPVKILRGHTDSVTAARLCFSDRRILSCSSDCTAILWDTDSCWPLRVFSGAHQRTITDCALIPNTNRMLTVSWDKKMVSWDMETGQILWKYQPGGLLTSCSSSSDGRLLVCAADPQNGVYVVDAASGQIQHHVSDHHRSTITQCRFDPQSQRIATVSEDRSVKLWDLCSHKTTVSIDNAHGNVIANCCFTSDGCFLCTASWDKTLKLWDLHSGGFRCHGGTLLQKGHEGSVSSCSFSADGKLLVSGSYDKTVALWDMPSLCQTVTLKGHSDWVTDVSVSADGKLLASASKDHTIRLWNIENTEDIPQVMKKKTQATGSQIVQCEECGKPFPVCRLQSSELLTKCVFCRLKTPTVFRPQLPPHTSL